jgi:hydrogenase nickel incorporation protein HypA/HybF
LIFIQVYNFPGSVKLSDMHEIRIAEELSAIVLRVAGNENLSKVSMVNISFGTMIQVVPDIFERAFRECVRDSLADGAELSVEILPVKIRCNSCREEMGLEAMDFRCNLCGSADLEIIQGKEMFVKSIEGE